MEILKRLFHSISGIINLFVAFALILAGYSDLISPVRFNFPVLISLLFPIWLAGNLFFIVFWAIQRNRRIFISVVAMLIVSPAIVTYFPTHIYSGSAVNDSTSYTELKILTYNVHNFDRFKPHLKKKPNKIIDYIKSTDADIVCLQEYAFGYAENVITEKQIRQALKKYPYYHFLVRNKTQYARSGLALFSKFPIENIRKIKFGQESNQNGSCLYRINVNGRMLTLINNHLESNKFTESDRKVYKSVIKDFETDLLDEVKSKLINKMFRASRLRAKQADELARVIDEQDDNIIVCGDFNDTPMSYIYKTVKGDLQDAYVETGFGPGITYHENGFWFRIDHVLHGSDFKALDTSIDKVKYSDHYPLTATLLWKENKNGIQK